MPRLPWGPYSTAANGFRWNHVMLHLSLILPYLLLPTTFASPQCDAGYGSGLRYSDCLEAINRLPFDYPNSLRALSFFSEDNRDPRFRIPYATSSANGACHLGVAFTSEWDDDVNTSWAEIRLAAQGLALHCVSRLGWGGWSVVLGTRENLKVMVWEEMEEGEDEAGGSQTARTQH